MNNTDSISFRPDPDADSQRKRPIIQQDNRDDFKKVMNKKSTEQRTTNTTGPKKRLSGDEQDIMAEDDLYSEEEKRLNAGTGLSLFDLPTTDNEEGNLESELSEKELAEMSEKIRELPLSQIFKHLNASIKSEMREDNLLGAAASLSEEINEMRKGKVSTQFTHEQPDLASINPLANSQPISAINATSNTQTTGTVAVELQEIIDQIVNKIYTLEVDGRTDTVITLKYPPSFAGVNLVISAFASAKKEFNVSFENLSLMARNLVVENENALRLSLANKGYTVHIVVATTYTETRPVFEGEQTNRGREDKEDNTGSNSNQNGKRGREEG